MLSFIVASLAVSSVVYVFRKEVNMSLMRLFRDLSRYKARKRLYGDKYSLVAIMTGEAPPLTFDYGAPGENGDGFTMTPAELALMDGRTEETPIYLSIKGHIYDLSTARDMYGPEGSYKLLAARDSTLPFAYGCCEAKCMGKYTGAGKTWYSDTVVMKLTDEENKEVDSWVELYHTHDRYIYVGELVQDTIDQVLSKEEAEALEDEQMDNNSENNSNNDSSEGGGLNSLKAQLEGEQQKQKQQKLKKKKIEVDSDSDGEIDLDEEMKKPMVTANIFG
jgi:hypothetical protein